MCVWYIYVNVWFAVDFLREALKLNYLEVRENASLNGRIRVRGHAPRAENLSSDWIAKTQLAIPTSSHQILPLKARPHSDRLHVQLASLPLYSIQYLFWSQGCALENGPLSIRAGSIKARLIASSVLPADPDWSPSSILGTTDQEQSYFLTSVQIRQICYEDCYEGWEPFETVSTDTNPLYLALRHCQGT